MFDFGRSTVGSGTYKFKEQWGAQPSPAVWQYYGRRGSTRAMRPDNGKFGLAIHIWQRLPLWLAMLVVGRDVLIVLGVVLIQRCDPVFRARPLLIGKVNTFAQLSLAACALAHAGGVMDLSMLVAALIVAVSLTTALSGAGYAAQALRALGRERAS